MKVSFSYAFPVRINLEPPSNLSPTSGVTFLVAQEVDVLEFKII
jgi:hypothetical protein